MNDLPDYTVRESARTKHVRLTVSVHDGLVVVVPSGFGRARIPGILAEKKRWIDRAMSERERRRELMEPVDELPERLALHAIDEDWAVDHREDGESCVRVTEQPGYQLLVHGAIAVPDLWRSALRRWVVAKAKQHLISWLGIVAEEHGFRVGKVTIRCQKTRWGSRSQRGTISLNAQLLFVPPRLVRYVFLHEPCHSVHHDHSAGFWKLLRQHEPQADRLRKELRTAWRYVPAWFTA